MRVWVLSRLSYGTPQYCNKVPQNQYQYRPCAELGRKSSAFSQSN